MPVGEWKSEEIDALLELVLPCKDELEYQRCLVTFAAFYDKPASYGLDEVDQLLRRRANRYQDYIRLGEGRTSRAELEWTYAERRLLAWAKNPNPSESKAEPDPAYLAGILCRPVEEVAAVWYAGPGGIKGFFPPF